MSARDSYPLAYDFTTRDDATETAFQRHVAEALDEIDRLRSAVILQGLTIQSGDTLIVRLGTNVTVEHAMQIKDNVLARLPLLTDVVVISADEIAVYRP